MCSRLVLVFKVLPDTRIHTRGGLEFVGAERWPGIWDEETARDTACHLLAAAARHLGDRDYIMLLTWARARATKRSIRELCRMLGWGRATLYRRVDAAAEQIAAGINGDLGLANTPETERADGAAAVRLFRRR